MKPPKVRRVLSQPWLEGRGLLHGRRRVDGARALHGGLGHLHPRVRRVLPDAREEVRAWGLPRGAGAGA